MTRFWVCLRFWIAQDFEYVSGFECAKVLDIATRVLNMSLVLNMPGFWIYQSSEYARVTHGSKYAGIIPEYAWICLNMPEYAWICLNLPEWLLIYIFPVVKLHYTWCLNVYRRLQVIVWRKMKLFSWRDKILFFPILFVFLFQTKYFYK